MEKVVSVHGMRACDAAKIAEIGSIPLIEQAGKAIRDAHSWKGPVTVVCGTGNNAADGFVLARLLHRDGIPVRIVLAKDAFSKDGEVLFALARDAGVPYERYTGGALPRDGEIADCLLGTGFHGEVEGVYKELIEAINESREQGAYVVSVDINSGIAGDNGTGPVAVRSDLTVSIGMLQPGHILGAARDCIGELLNCPIGIDLIPDEKPLAYFPDRKDLGARIPKRRHDSHKGDYGYVTVIGGCREYGGAAKLASMAAASLRVGCGVVRLAVPDCIADAVAPYILEQTLSILPSKDGFLRYDEDALRRAIRGSAAVAFGMGIGQFEDHAKTLRFLLRECTVPLLIDADGLNTLAAIGTDALTDARCPVILTPHPKEFERLSGIPIAKMKENPIPVAKEFAARYGVILLLKGTGTVVTDGNTAYLANRGSAGMATAGSGDVLSGVLAGLLGYLPPDAMTVTLGAYLCGAAGELAADAVGEIGMTAGDTVRALPEAIRAVVRE